MKLRKFSLVGGIFLSLTIFTVHLLISDFVIKGGFLEIEQQQILHDLRAARNEINNRVKQLDVFVLDWASWDDTYAFVQDRNRQFVASNLPDSTFAEQGLSAIIIRDVKGQMAYGRALDDKGEDNTGLLQGFLGKLSGEIPLLKGEGQGRGGIARIGKTFYLLAERPILTSDGLGPPMGTIAMAKPLTEKTIADISERLGLTVEVRTPETDPVLADALDRSKSGKVTRNIDDATVLAASLLQTLGGGHSGLILVTKDRQITQYGRKVAVYNTVVIAVAIIMFALLAYLLLHFKLLNRLERLEAQVSSIGGTGEGRILIDVEGADEITDLSSSINSLLAAIAQSHQEQLAQSEEIADNEKFLNQIMNSVSVGILLVDPDTRKIETINDHALTLAGRTREEVVGNVCHKLTCPAERNNCPILDKDQPHDLSRRELLTKDGSTIPIMKTVSFVEKRDRSFLLETIIDITEIEQSRMELERIKEGLEEIVAERTQDLAKANKELIALDKAKTLFLSSASHELRTPLTSILGFLKLMERGFNKDFYPHLKANREIEPKAEKFMQNLSVVRSEAERLGRLVNDLLDLNKIRSGRMEWRDEVLSIQDLLERASETFEARAAGKPEVDFIVDRPEEQLTIMADRDRIQQVMINLLDNAFKFTKKGHVRLTVQSREDVVAIRVCDTGKGIATEDREQIFDLFYQVRDENQRSSKEFGTGLGLAICRQIVTHYGGEIYVESTDRQRGTCFLFTIPKAGNAQP